MPTLERPQGELKEYKPLEIDYNVKSAVENLKTAYWSNDPEKYAQAFTEADQMIVSAICHYGYIVVKGGESMGKSAEEINERLINEYISKVECCDKCFASVFCTVNGLRKSRVPQDYCVDNIKSYFGIRR